MGTVFLDNTYAKPRFRFPPLDTIFEHVERYIAELFADEALDLNGLQ